jgi:hypothetical protein
MKGIGVDVLEAFLRRIVLICDELRVEEAS